MKSSVYLEIKVVFAHTKNQDPYDIAAKQMIPEFKMTKGNAVIIASQVIEIIEVNKDVEGY